MPSSLFAVSPSLSHTIKVAATLLPLLPLTACTGGIHRQGQHQLSLHGSYGFPIKGDTLWPEGLGQAENVGVTIGYGYFARDRLALRAALTPYRRYRQPDGDAHAGELQVGLRYYFWDFEIGDTPVGLYAEALGGLMHASRRIPAGGAHTNFTQDAGVGFEVQFSDQISWITGYRYRHISHGHVFAGDPNPGQNDNQVYTGLAIMLN